MTFGQRLKMLRQERGFSQEEMGRAVGVSSRVIGYYEADERFPKSRDTLVAFAEVFNVSLDYLLDNPVRGDETGCPARFCYMKSMNSSQREAVNEFIGYLRYRNRKEEVAALEAASDAHPYKNTDLSPDIVEMLESWGEPDGEEQEEPTPENPEVIAEAPSISTADSAQSDEAAEKDTASDETPGLGSDSFDAFGEEIIPPPTSDYRRFFQDDFFVDDFFGDDTQDK